MENKRSNENIDNLLFDLAKIRCEIVFLNKARHIEESEGIKIILNDMFKTVYVDIKSTANDNDNEKEKEKEGMKRFMMSYSERDQSNDENALLLVNNITFTLYISIGEEEKQERFISTYQKHLNQTQEDPSKLSLHHLILFFTKNTAETLVVNQSDHIHFCTMQPEDIHSTLQSVLSKILTDYYTLIISKPSILNGAGNSLIIKDVIDIKNRCEEYLHIGLYDQAKIIFPLLSDMIKIPTEQIKFKECLAITKFLINYEHYREMADNNGEGVLGMGFNQDIETLYEAVFNGYKKAKQHELLVESYLRLACYYSFFNDKRRECIDYIQKVQNEAVTLHSHTKIKLYLHCYTLFSDMSLKRKGCLYLYLAIAACYEAPQTLLNIIPYLFKEINKTFPIYDVFTDQINSIDSFNEIHAEIIKNGWKKISFCECKRESSKREMVEVNKKRIEKDYELYVIRNLVKYNRLLLSSTWQPIQYNILINLITFFKGIGDIKMKIANSICLLQTLSDFLSLNDQKSYLEEHNKDSTALQEKINLNMVKIPVLIKIIPLPGDIKIEKKNKFNMSQGKNSNSNSQSNSNSNANSNRNTMNNNSVFIYNPWEKTKGVNYFWTVNSFQMILIELYNPLSIPLTINKINIIFEGVIPFSFPSSVSIEPLSTSDVIFKIRPLKEGLTSIKGIKYEIENTIGIQHVDSNGNGIFFSYENVSKDPYSLANYKKEVLQLDNIQIFPEMPKLDMKVLDDSSKMSNEASLELYEYQYYPFSFLLENISSFPIEEIQVVIYAFKKDDYKVSLEEIILRKTTTNDGNDVPIGNLIEVASNYVFNYNYIHRKGHKKVEFRFNYKFKSDDYDKLTVKPFCYYLRKVSSKKLFSFNNIRVASMLSNRITSDIIKSDPRIKQNYSYCFASNRYYISFEMSLLQEDVEMSYEFNNKAHNLLKKSTIDSIASPKDITMVIENKNKLNETEMLWELFNQSVSSSSICIGKIDLFQLMANELNYKFIEGIIFDIATEQITNEDGIRCVLLKYAIENKNKKVYRNLKFFIYLYQTYEDTLVFNMNLHRNILYEGSLFYAIEELKGLEVRSYEVLLYPPENEIISTTCLLIDDDYKVVHISTITKQCCLLGEETKSNHNIEGGIPFALKQEE